MVKFSIEDRIRIVTLAIEAGILETHIYNCLIAEGFPHSKVCTMLRWARKNAVPFDRGA